MATPAKIFTVLVVFVVVGVLLGSISKTSCQLKTDAFLTINDSVTLAVHVADSGLEQQKGLSHCSSIPNKVGMYFVVNPNDTPVFWMKDMKIPIDIVWISDNSVIGVEENVPPSVNIPGELQLYQPDQPVTAVLELAAGQARALNIDSESKTLLIWEEI